ncbi:putative topoisomerase I damage affected protein [Clavispora lusitaniae]|uniref:Topoisomerase I damage affected protein n=1 Tax=Clavispora lusitaniae TaxID=36911 RepID=A0AA91PZ85_CLALS|nr:putative topoisomerase I damage affected protein [Clavispora lusitaniae]
METSERPNPAEKRLNLPSMGISRTKSRSKGINFNTVSPGQDTKAVKAPTPSITPSPVKKKPISSPLNHEFTLPSADELSMLGIDEQLRLLALKEMAVVEIKDGISDLENKLLATEQDLGQLRRLIQRSLYREMTHSGPGNGVENQNPHSRSEEDPSSKLWSNLAKPISFIQSLDALIQHEFEKSLEPPGLSTKDHRSTQEMSSSEKASQSTTSKVPRTGRDTKRVPRDSALANGTGPLREASRDRSSSTRTSLPGTTKERKLRDATRKPSLKEFSLKDSKQNTNSDHDGTTSQLSRRKSEHRSEHRPDSRPEYKLELSRPLKDKTNTHTQEWAKPQHEDMFQAVSTSLWTFVNDMKTNMLASLNEDSQSDGAAEQASPSTSDLICLSPQEEEEEEESVDLSMYSSMRRSKASNATRS